VLEILTSLTCENNISLTIKSGELFCCILTTLICGVQAPLSLSPSRVETSDVIPRRYQGAKRSKKKDGYSKTLTRMYLAEPLARQIDHLIPPGSSTGSRIIKSSIALLVELSTPGPIGLEVEVGCLTN
jgi:hypothetical protein